MSTLTMLRLYFKMQHLPRLPLPNIGYVGILYPSSHITRNKNALAQDAVKSTDSPEFQTQNLTMKKGSIGQLHFRRFSTSVEDIKKAEKERTDKNKFKLRTAETVKVLLVSEKGTLTSVTLDEAKKISKKRGFNLVHIQNKSEKPVGTDKEIYKLVSRTLNADQDLPMEESDEQENKSTSTKQKELKTVLLNSNIANHDAMAKVNGMKKWITKGHRVRVQISEVGDKDAESLFQFIATHTADVGGQIQQKIKKEKQVRFYVGPPKQTSSTPHTPPGPRKKNPNKTLTSDKEENAENNREK